MRICATCGEAYRDGVLACGLDGTALGSWEDATKVMLGPPDDDEPGVDTVRRERRRRRPISTMRYSSGEISAVVLTTPERPQHPWLPSRRGELALGAGLLMTAVMAIAGLRTSARSSGPTSTWRAVVPAPVARTPAPAPPKTAHLTIDAGPTDVLMRVPDETAVDAGVP